MSIYTRPDVKEIITTKYLGKQGKLLKIEEGGTLSIYRSQTVYKTNGGEYHAL